MAIENLGRYAHPKGGGAGPKTGSPKAYKIGPVKGPVAELRGQVEKHPDVHEPVKAVILAELAKIAGNGNTHAQVDAHGTEHGEHHVVVKPRPDLSSTPGGKFGYSSGHPAALPGMPC